MRVAFTPLLVPRRSDDNLSVVIAGHDPIGGQCGIITPAPSEKNFPHFHPPPSRLAYAAGIPSPRGRARDRLDHVERERRPRRSGPARPGRSAGNGPDRPGGLLRHPSGTTTGAPERLKKRGMETFRRRVGAPVRRDFTMQRLSRRSLTPRPVPDTCPGGGSTMGGSQTGRSSNLWGRHSASDTFSRHAGERQ
jgi:hypothetical protein